MFFIYNFDSIGRHLTAVCRLLSTSAFMHLETLKTFCDLVETGSFSRAAALNYISQSAVSQQVKTLEARFGVELIERSSRKKLSLTKAGQDLYRDCKEIVDRFKALELGMQQASATISGKIHIATVYSVGLHELPPYVKQFIQTHPQVKVQVEYSRTNKIYDACLNNLIDFGIVALPQRRPQLEIIPLRDDQLVLVCSPEHKFAGRRKIKLASIGGENFIAFEKDIPTRKEIDRILKRFDVRVNIAMEFDNIETIKRSVEAGNGIAILPDTVVATEVRNQQLVILKFTEGPFNRPIGIIHRKGKIFSPATREFIDMLKK